MLSQMTGSHGRMMRTSELPQQIAQRISLDIVAGALKPGDHVRTRVLADRFDVSRSPIRIALELLAKQGFLEQRQHKGYFVASNPPIDAAGEPRQIFDERERMSDYQRLADDWLTDRIPAEVTEQRLQDRYGLTRAKVRDMLVRAVREGWAERKQGYGWRFLPVAKTPQAFDQVYRFRMVIEPAALLEPDLRPDREVLEQLKETQQRMLDTDIWRLPAETLLENGALFHEELIRMSGNPFFHIALVRANRMRRLMEYRARIDRERVVVQCREHIEIADSVLQGDVVHASYLMRIHLSGALRRKSPVAWRWAQSQGLKEAFAI